MLSKCVLFKKRHLNKRPDVWTPPGSATGPMATLCPVGLPGAVVTAVVILWELEYPGTLYSRSHCIATMMLQQCAYLPYHFLHHDI